MVRLFGVAVTTDGKRAYVTTGDGNPNAVRVIATASNIVVPTVTMEGNPDGVAVNQDGKHAYIANDRFNNVSVIATWVMVKAGISPGQLPIQPEPLLIPAAAIVRAADEVLIDGFLAACVKNATSLAQIFDRTLFCGVVTEIFHLKFSLFEANAETGGAMWEQMSFGCVALKRRASRDGQRL